MLNKEINIRSFQKNLPEIIETVLQGDEIIITKSNIPIAKLTPIENPLATVKSKILSAKAIETKRILAGETPENWFG